MRMSVVDIQAQRHPSPDAALNAMARPNWIVCQIGAREHYVIAAELHARQRLSCLFTDIWFQPGRLLSFLPSRLRLKAEGRFEPRLRDARVQSIGRRGLLYATDLFQAERKMPDHQHLMVKNELFGDEVARRLTASGLLQPKDGLAPVVFAYSYAARAIFETAHRAGCRTVLGQIDPGPVGQDIVAGAAARHGFDVPRPPPDYWDNWRRECALADVIVVNSQWSRDALVQAGIPAAKIRIVPLAYDSRGAGKGGIRCYPPRFTRERPLKILIPWPDIGAERSGRAP